MKRKAEFDLDRKNLEANNFDPPLNRESVLNTGYQQILNRQVEQPQRRVVKIKLPSEILAEKVKARNLAKQIIPGGDIENESDHIKPKIPLIENPNKPLTGPGLSNQLINLQKVNDDNAEVIVSEPKKDTRSDINNEQPKVQKYPLFTNSFLYNNPNQDNQKVSIPVLNQSDFQSSSSLLKTTIPVDGSIKPSLIENKNPISLIQNVPTTASPIFPNTQGSLLGSDKNLLGQPLQSNTNFGPNQPPSLFGSISNQQTSLLGLKSQPLLSTFQTTLVPSLIPNSNQDHKKIEDSKILIKNTAKVAEDVKLKSSGESESKPTNQPEKVSLFSNLFTNSGNAPFLYPSKTGSTPLSTGLLNFQSTNPTPNIGLTTEKVEKNQSINSEKPEGSEKSIQPSGLFGNLLKNAAPSTGPQGLNLFSKLGENPKTFSDIFSKNAPQAASSTFFSAKNEEEEADEEEEGDDEPQRSPSPEVDPSKSETHVQFDDPFDKIISKDLEKFRCNDNPVLGKGTISLNKAKNNDAYFIVFRNPAKLVLYQGQILKNISKVSNFNNKQDVLQVKTISTKKEDASKTEKEDKDKKSSKYSCDLLKLMFTTNDACSEFKAQIEKIIT